MKKFVFFNIIQNLQSKPSFMKRLMIFAFIGILGLFIISGLTLWLGIKTFTFIKTKTIQMFQPNRIIKNEIQNVSKVKNVNSLEKIGNFTTVLDSSIKKDHKTNLLI